MVYFWTGVQKLEEDFNLIASYCRHGKYREIEEAISQVRPHHDTVVTNHEGATIGSERPDVQMKGRPEPDKL